MLRAQDGGIIEVTSSGKIDGCGKIWIEREEDLLLSEGAQERICGDLLIFCEETLFRNAAHVNSREEYLAAIADEQVPAIVVDSSLFGVDSSFFHEKPVLISEGVILDAWFVGDALLVNRGTISGDLHAYGGSSGILNYGSINGTVSTDGFIINYGSIATGYSQLRGKTINLGWFVHTNRFVDGSSVVWGNSFLDIACDSFINDGEMRIEDTAWDDAFVTSQFVSNLMNSGTITVTRDTRLELNNWTDNCGSIIVEAGGELAGTGYIEQSLPGASLTVDAEAHVSFDGLLTYSYLDSAVDVGSADSLTQLDFAWIHSGETLRRVASEEDLRRALEDEACTLVFVDDVEAIEIHGDLHITKGVAFAVPLTVVDGDLILTGENAFVISYDTALNGGRLILEQGAVWLNRSNLDCGSIQVGAGSLLQNQWGPVSTENLEISGRVINLESWELESTRVRIQDGGVLRSSGRLGMENCQVDIAQNGTLISTAGQYRLDAGTAVINRGVLSLYGWMWQEQSLEGQITNFGRMELNGGADGVDMYQDSQAWLRGTLTNYGTLLLYNEYPVSGTLDNQGTLILSGEHARLVPVAGGAVTGNPARYE